MPTRKAALALLLLVIVAGVVIWIFSKDPTVSKGPMLEWDGSAGATRYEVQIDGTLLGSFTEPRAPLPRGFVASEHKVQVRACNAAACSAWQPLTGR